VARDSASLRTLKAHSRKFPEVEHLLYIISDAADPEEQDDRTSAMISGALLDMFLERAIKSKFRQLDEEEDSGIFRNNGPLASMSSRIRLARALGLISNEIREELDNIREIRNAFAHSVVPIKFDNPAVTNVCARLWTPDRYPPDNPKHVRSAKGRFLLATRVIWMILSHTTLRGNSKLNPSGELWLRNSILSFN
jgi:DNA-binding MltR family transcriptional regulator